MVDLGCYGPCFINFVVQVVHNSLKMKRGTSGGWECDLIEVLWMADKAVDSVCDKPVALHHLEAGAVQQTETSPHHRHLTHDPQVAPESYKQDSDHQAALSKLSFWRIQKSYRNTKKPTLLSRRKGTEAPSSLRP